MRSLLGTTLEGRYHVLEPIGEGGMGHVFLAEHVTLKRRVAIKVLREELASQPANVERFLQEAQAASSIHHPNVVDVTDFGRAANGTVYFVMEFLEGEELTAMMHRHRYLPWASVQAIGLQVVRGLRATHAQGVVYRDLKPANIYLTRDPQGSLVVKLLDFGIAKHTGNTQRPQTKPNSVFGTARYMSPEQAAGKDVDARSDIYAAGVVLYELLTGRAPFESDNFMEVVRCHVNDPIPRLRDVAPRDADIPDAVDALVMRALEKDPAKRFHDMSEFEAAIMAASMDDATRISAFASGQPVPESFEDVGHTMIWDAEQGRIARETASAGARVVSPDHVDATRIRPRPEPTVVTGRPRGGGARVMVAPPGQPPRRTTVIASHAPQPPRHEPDPAPPPMQDFQPVLQTQDLPDPSPLTPMAPEVRRGDGAFFASSTAASGGHADGQAAPVLPGGFATANAGGSAPHAHQTLPPVNWGSGAPNPPTGNYTSPEQNATEEFALRVPDRAPSRNRAVIVVVLAAALFIGVGVAAWAVFFAESDPVGDELYPTVAEEQLEPFELGKPKAAEPADDPFEPAQAGVVAPTEPSRHDPSPSDPRGFEPDTNFEPDADPQRPAESERGFGDPDPDFEPEPDPDFEPEPEPKKPAKTATKKKSSGSRGNPISRGFGKARKAIKACGTQHGAIAGTAFDVTFDVSNGRAANVKVQPPHSVTSLGRCVARMVASHARFNASNRTGQKRRVKF